MNVGRHLQAVPPTPASSTSTSTEADDLDELVIFTLRALGDVLRAVKTNAAGAASPALRAELEHCALELETLIGDVAVKAATLRKLASTPETRDDRRVAIEEQLRSIALKARRRTRRTIGMMVLIAADKTVRRVASGTGGYIGPNWFQARDARWYPPRMASPSAPSGEDYLPEPPLSLPKRRCVDFDTHCSGPTGRRLHDGCYKYIRCQHHYALASVQS